MWERPFDTAAAVAYNAATIARYPNLLERVEQGRDPAVMARVAKLCYRMDLQSADMFPGLARHPDSLETVVDRYRHLE